MPIFSHQKKKKKTVMTIASHPIMVPSRARAPRRILTQVGMNLVAVSGTLICAQDADLFRVGRFPLSFIKERIALRRRYMSLAGVCPTASAEPC